MAKLYFIQSTMNAGKSSQLLQTNFNYEERGMKCLLLTAAVDDRSGVGKISSRLGLSAEAQIFGPNDNLMDKYLIDAAKQGMACVLVDEAQFLTRKQVAQLAHAVDRLNLPVMAYGLRTDFRGMLFEGTSALVAMADEIRELRTICHCGKKASMVLRLDKDGKPTLNGNQIEIGGNDKYITVCRKHWVEAHRNSGAEDPLAP